ncbi:MAG: DUF2007 domain-containing protein [Myxococcaceae bacterium]|nr:DUF2007 domain-containing protein [Myxococcaceae bacterium]
MAGDAFELLQECATPIEAAQLTSFLTAHGIEHVVQGEAHAALIPGPLGGALIVPRVLVARRDLERARALLASDLSPESQDGQVFDGAVCPVHERQAVGTCARCGTFLCAGCQTLGNPPVCESCLAAEATAPAGRGGAGRVFVWVLLAGVILTFAFNALRRLW